MESTSIIFAFFLCSSLWSSGAYGAPTNPSIQEKALNFMHKFGYIEGSEGGSEAQPLLGNITDENFKEAIKEMQRFGALEITGELDDKTLELMSAKRCGVADIVKDSTEYSPVNEDLPPESKDIDEHHHEHHEHHHHHHHHHQHEHSRRKRYILASRGWNKRHITYYLENWPENLSREEVLDVVQTALGTWEKHAKLRFIQVSSPEEGDIVFGFYRRKHADPFAFDGPGSVLAHAFTPIQRDEKGFDGDVHFDADEKWIVNLDEEGIDLMSTAVHELGHSLGLSHSPERDSVMFPYYMTGNRELGYDDILAMYELYVKRNWEDDSGEGYIPRQPTRPPPTRRPTTTTTASSRTTTSRYEETSTKRKHWHGSWHGTKPLDGCNGAFDTVALIRGELFITKKKMMWRLKGPGEVQKGYPVEFKRMFALPENVKRIDAMYERQTDSSVVIFSGGQFWVFDGKVLSSPRPLTDYGLPWRMVKVDAVAVRNGSTYIFSGSDYWTYDDYKKTLTNSSRPLSDWGIPWTSVDSVMTYKDGNTYIFKGDHYWIYNGRHLAPPTGSKSASQFWLSC